MHGQLRSSRERLHALGLRPRRGLSQSFLDDVRVAATIVRAAHLDPEDEVLEVGPGLGILTDRLVNAARRVVAVELDAHLAEQLSAPNLHVIVGDILQTEIRALFDRPFVVVANLPYHITSPAIRHLLAAQPKRVVIMTQREVAERIAAQPGQMSALAVAVQVQATVRLVRTVPASAFFPKPKVDSAVLVLEPRPKPLVDDLGAFTALVQAGFKQPRKQLANSLADGLQIDKPAAIARLTHAGIDPTHRAQELAVEDWLRLS
ncbi:MAG TPA: 16S rRNA (adenine(1518)-N(6)/adenine(1519)-N(6))-dimethyltransferase RsmA [Chloroflexota bacterium]